MSIAKEGDGVPKERGRLIRGRGRGSGAKSNFCAWRVGQWTAKEAEPSFFVCV